MRQLRIKNLKSMHTACRWPVQISTRLERQNPSLLRELQRVMLCAKLNWMIATIQLQDAGVLLSLLGVQYGVYSCEWEQTEAHTSSGGQHALIQRMIFQPVKTATAPVIAAE